MKHVILERGRFLLILAAVLGTGGMMGCDSGSPTPAPELTPAQIIEKAAPAVQAANSFHFSLETSKLDKAMPGLFITMAQGDVAKPDKLSADVSVSFSGLPLNIKAVVDGDKQFMTDPASGVWQTSSLAIDVKQYFNPARGVSDILGGIKGLAADGKETIDNSECYRLKGNVPASALKSLSPDVTATGDLTTTLWIGTSDYLLRRVRLEGPIDTNEPTNIVRTIGFKDYNQPVKIETPVIK